MPANQEMLDYWMGYFLATRDVSTKVWLLSGKPSPALDRTYDFDAGGFGISVIDQFDGKQLFLVDYDFAARRTGAVNFLPTLILDSNVVDYLTSYVNEPSRLSDDQYRATRSLLEFAVRLGCDYNPFFYYLESVAKNGEGKAREHALGTAKALLSLHTMDEELFLREDRIVTDPAVLELTAQRFGGPATIEETARNMADAMTSLGGGDAFNRVMDYTYAALLKMVLIHLGGRRAVEEKARTLSDFMEDEMNLVLARENAIAPYYFAGRLDKFIPVKKGMSSFAKARGRLRATAWDFLFLRMPEFLLGLGDSQETSLGYVCTGESDLRKVGRLFTVEQLVATSAERAPAAAVSFTLSATDRRLDDEVISRIVGRQAVRVEARLKEVARGDDAPISRARLTDMIADLEEQMRVTLELA